MSGPCTFIDLLEAAEVPLILGGPRAFAERSLVRVLVHSDTVLNLTNKSAKCAKEERTAYGGEKQGKRRAREDVAEILGVRNAKSLLAGESHLIEHALDEFALVDARHCAVVLILCQRFHQPTKPSTNRMRKRIVLQ
jgi:hypothetical protein